MVGDTDAALEARLRGALVATPLASNRTTAAFMMNLVVESYCKCVVGSRHYNLLFFSVFTQGESALSFHSNSVLRGIRCRGKTMCQYETNLRPLTPCTTLIVCRRNEVDVAPVGSSLIICMPRHN